MPQQPSPDIALLAAGWERNAETDTYRLPGCPWRSHEAARAVAFPPDADEEAPVSPPETTMIALLGDILTELKQINATLGRKVLP